MSQPTAKSMGRGMLAGGCILALGMLTWMFQGVLDRQVNPNSSPSGRIDSDGMREVVLQRNRQGHYVSGGRINGRPVLFLLDTGATDVAIPLEVARQVDLSRGFEGRAQTANGAAVIYDTHIDELELGNIVLRDIDASIVPGMGGQTILLGMSALRQIEFSQQGDRLTLRHYPLP